MLQTIIGNVFIGGLLLFSVLALLVPIFVEVQKRLHLFSAVYLRKVFLPFFVIAVVLALFLALVN